MRKFLLLLGVTILAFTGCGGDDGDDGDTGADAAAGTSEEGSAGADDQDTDFSGSGSGDFCALAKDYMEEFDDAGEGSGDIEAEYRELVAAIDNLASEAPGEIKDDVEVVNDAFKRSVAVLEKYDFDFTKIPEDEAEAANIDTPEVEAASNRVESYFEKVCELDTDDDGDTDGIIEDGSDDTVDDTTEDEQAPDESVDE